MAELICIGVLIQAVTVLTLISCEHFRGIK